MEDSQHGNHFARFVMLQGAPKTEVIIDPTMRQTSNKLDDNNEPTVLKTKTRMKAENSPTNAMGHSFSTQGPIQTFDAPLGRKKKRVRHFQDVTALSKKRSKLNGSGK